MSKDRTNPYLLHFTHLDNLPGIVTEGLIADSRRPRLQVECAEREIKDRRRYRRVPCGPGGVVADYVPFYFAERSPMLRRIHGGKVRGYADGQRRLIYLVTRLSLVTDLGLAWVATDHNAVVDFARFTNAVEAIPTHIDWDLMDVVQWKNTPEDGLRKSRRMAELLVHHHVPWVVITHLYARDEGIAEQARAIIADADARRPVGVRPRWYF